MAPKSLQQLRSQEPQNPTLGLLFKVSPLQADRQRDKGTPSWELEIWYLQIIESPPLEQWETRQKSGFFTHLPSSCSVSLHRPLGSVSWVTHRKSQEGPLDQVVLVTLEEGSRGRAGGGEQGGNTCSEEQKGCSVSTRGHVLVQLKTSVHSVILGVGERRACVIGVGVFVWVRMYTCAGVACGVWVYLGYLAYVTPWHPA